VITRLARLLTRGFFRSVETEGPALPAGPVILAASHLNGFVDPVVLVAELRAFPRFLAKATLWKAPVARFPLDFARVIPVQRRVDAGDRTDNAGTFDAAVAALAQGHLLAVFPEGTTHDDPTIRPLRTGVARIALQAAADGVDGVQIVPVGVSYEDKVAVRGRALVTFGEPIPVPPGDVALDDHGDPDHETVRALTDRLTTDLQALTPHFGSTEDAVALTEAAQITLRSRGAADPVPMHDVADDARVLAAAEPEELRHLVDRVARYEMLLRWVGLEDRDLTGGTTLTSLTRRAVVLGILLLVLAPLALAGLFANLIPLALVLAAGLIVKAPVTKGTVRFLAGFVAFPIMWLVVALGDASDNWLGQTARQVTYPADVVLGGAPTDRSGAAANLLVLVLVPLLGAVALVVAERLVAFLRTLDSWRRLLDRRGQLTEVRARRADVVAATEALLAHRSPP
jgi:1-acyl-sn-glycerol-3-phosphate acyltransferase